MAPERLSANTYLSAHRSVLEAEAQAQRTLGIQEKVKSMSQKNLFAQMARGADETHIKYLIAGQIKINLRNNRAASHIAYLEHRKFMLAVTRVLENLGEI